MELEWLGELCKGRVELIIVIGFRGLAILGLLMPTIDISEYIFCKFYIGLRALWDLYICRNKNTTQADCLARIMAC